MAAITSVIREDARLVADDLRGELTALADTSVCVTGAAGFLGSFLLDVLAAASDATPLRVLALDNFRTGVPDRLAHLARHPRFELVTHDVTQPFTPSRRVDWIVHAASVASPTFYRRFPLETIDVNVNGTWRMLELAGAGARGVLVLSSSEIYGDPRPEAIPTPETYHGNVSPTGPRACYDESKRLGETLCTTYFRLHGTPVTIVRPFNVYGPGQRLDDLRIIPDLMSAALARRPLVLFSDGRATRSFCHVRDAIRAVLLLLIAGDRGEAFNVGNDEEVTVAQLAELMADVAGPPRLAVEYRVSADQDYLKDNPQRRCPDLTKVRSRTRWRPQVPLRDGLARTLQSYREAAGAS
jgi:UDP-glucuronate decarboxylase